MDIEKVGVPGYCPTCKVTRQIPVGSLLYIPGVYPSQWILSMQPIVANKSRCPTCGDFVGTLFPLYDILDFDDKIPIAQKLLKLHQEGKIEMEVAQLPNM